MKPNLNHRHYLFLISVVLSSAVLTAQEKKSNYGNIPDELVAYDKYQKAYKYHFLEPMKFYGAGREKPEPTGLKEVRIGFLGPLEGSILMNLGQQMLQGASLPLKKQIKKADTRVFLSSL